MKRVLFVTTVSGFLYKFEMKNVHILQDLGYEVHYAANMQIPNYLFDEAELTDSGVKLHHIDIAQSPYEFAMNSKALKQLKNIIRTEDIKLVHCHTPVGGMLGRRAGKKFHKSGVKVIYTAHGFHFYKGASGRNNFLFRNVEKALARWTDVLITINSEDFENAKKFKLRPGGEVYMIPGEGLDFDEFTPVSKKEREECRERLGLKEDDFFMLSVGEFSENKNHFTVIKMLNQMKQSGADMSGLRYGICGEGFYRSEIERLVREYGLEDIVTLYGYCKPVQPYLACADVFVFPSQREGLGMAAIEALARGVPVVAADNRGTREYMIPGKNGYICRWDDIDGYMEHIKKIRSLSSESLSEMREYCMESVKRFDSTRSTEIMRRIYGRVDCLI